MRPAPLICLAFAASSADPRSRTLTGTASTPRRAAWSAPRAVHRATEPGPSMPAAVGNCTYRDGLPANKPASSAAITGRYSPLPTRATGPGIAPHLLGGFIGPVPVRVLCPARRVVGRPGDRDGGHRQRPD